MLFGFFFFYIKLNDSILIQKISIFRTRVHAQRKFAQGQGSSSYLTNFPSQQNTPVKESSEPPPELLPNLRPKPEDFLTFLCFRGTSVLPPHLDYFNQNKKSETETKEDTAKDDTATSDAKNNDNKDADVSCPKPSGSGAGNSSENLHGKDLKVESKEVAKPSFIPFAVRKHAETVSDGKRRQTVQALKRKYQEQRLAKTQVQNLIKTTQNRRTRSSGKGDDIDMTVEKKKVPSEHKADDVTETKKVEEKKKKEVNENKSDDSSKRKTSLRNTRNNPPKEDVQPESTKTDLTKASVKKKTKVLEDEEKVSAKVEKTPPATETTPKEIKKEPTKIAPQKQLVTRQQAASVPQSSETKTKPLTTHDNNPAEFSDSSDDRPLVSAFKKSTNVTKKPVEASSSKAQKPAESEKNKDQSVATSTSKPLKRQSPKPTTGVSRRSCGLVEVTKRSESVSRKSETSEPCAKKKTVGRKKKEKEESDDSSSEKVTLAKKKLNEKRSPEKEKEISKHKTKIDDDGVKKKRKRRNEFTELGNVEINDSDACRSARPSRKTKEAAAIYMELIGQKLNLDDFDDDGFSMDSFPELPNVKKTQQMENKLKANIGKPTDVKVSPKKNKPENKSSKKDEKEEIVVDTQEPPKKEKAKVGRKKKLLSPSKDVSPEIAVKKEKSLQKSFSDSDDEPLAVKITKKPKVIKGRSPKKAKELKETEKIEEKIFLNDVKDKVKQENVSKEKSAGKVTTSLVSKATDSVQEKSSDIPKSDITTAKVPTIAPKTSQLSFESVFKTPAETSSQLLSPSICTTPLKPSQMDTKNITNTSSSPKSITTTHETKSNLPNLMPSAEESGKIFGIASVTLAQSSGPNDTKCTLGKCGSIHVPTLGPVIPTELPSTDPTTSKEKQRRAKVNMSRAQIQKWILECARARYLLNY